MSAATVADADSGEQSARYSTLFSLQLQLLSAVLCGGGEPKEGKRQNATGG